MRAALGVSGIQVSDGLGYFRRFFGGGVECKGDESINVLVLGLIVRIDGVGDARWDV